MDRHQAISDFLAKRHYAAINPVAALIDMDGTLYDSMGHHADALMKMVSGLGINMPRDEFFRYEGRTGASTINIIFNKAYGRDATQEEIERLYHLKTEYFNSMSAVAPMPGAAQLLDMMQEIGMRRVLVTGSGQASLIERLERDFPGAFSPQMMVTSRNVTHGKPHPEPYIRAMQMARVKPSQSIAIENAPLGVKSASAAGAFTIGLTTGPIPGRELKEAGADIVYPSMQALADDFHNLVYDMFNSSLG